MDPMECVLKAENCAVAARLDTSGNAFELMALSAFWRARSVEMLCLERGMSIYVDDAPPPAAPRGN